MKTNAALLAAAFLITPHVHADSFGSGGNAFTIDFVTIGNPGNPVEIGRAHV